MILNYCADDLMSSIGVKDGAPYLGFIKRCDVPEDLLKKVDDEGVLDNDERMRIVDAVSDRGVMIRMEEPRAAFALLNLMSIIQQLVASPFSTEGLEKEAPFNPVAIH